MVHRPRLFFGNKRCIKLSVILHSLVLMPFNVFITAAEVLTTSSGTSFTLEPCAGPKPISASKRCFVDQTHKIMFPGLKIITHVISRVLRDARFAVEH
jgi:hypothetical protein